MPPPIGSELSRAITSHTVFECGHDAVDHRDDARRMPKVLMRHEPDFVDRPASAFRPDLHEAVTFGEMDPPGEHDQGAGEGLQRPAYDDEASDAYGLDVAFAHTR